MDNKSLPKLITIILVLIYSSMTFSKNLFAGEGDSTTLSSISWKLLIIGVFGGLAFFLYGMVKMSDGMKKAAGNRMRYFLSVLTRNRMTALIMGAIVTILVQSSSATTVMLVGFVHAGLMDLAQTLGIMLGADIGTTVTVQLIAFNVTNYALLMVALGFALQIVPKADNIRNIGEIIFGFGILFYGMKLMSNAMEPLRGYEGFINTMKGLENPFMGVIIGTLFTALIQSSAASIGVVIVLAHQGLITLESGIPLIFGANIGTCITAGLASINTSREAKRVALAHILFKIIGVMIFIFWIPGFAELIRLLSNRFGSDTARQIANAHTIFNVGIALIFIPFTVVFSRLIVWILPDKEEDMSIKPRVMFLDEGSLSSPALGIELARREISHMAGTLGRMLRAVIVPFMSDEKFIKKRPLTKEEKELLIKEIPTHDESHPQLTLLEGVDMREERLDYLNEKIGEFLIKISKKEISRDQANEVYGMISIASDMESIGDLIHRNLVKLIAKKHELDVDFSDEGKEELMIYHQKVCRQIDLLEQAFAERDLEKARRIMEGERKYLDLEEQYRIRHLQRIRHERKDSISTHEVHMEMMDILKQIVVYSSNIAKTFLLRCGAK
jgi:phosphate:Na+ symporter